MAGIAGLILKKTGINKDYNTCFKLMLDKLAYSESQLRDHWSNEKYYFGNVIPVSSSKNDHFQYNSQLNVISVIDGLVFVNAVERSALLKKYALNSEVSDYSLIPLLYHLYGNEFIKYITGWFNIFIYNEAEQNALLVNDRLGLLPLYYYNSDTYFIFASKLESILASGLIPKINFDYTTILEHLFFNYPLSDFTYLKDINTLSNAELFNISLSEEVNKKKYWSIAELYNYTPLNEKESFDSINLGLHSAISKITSGFTKEINMSLTGGWDSRVVLSYFLPDHKNLLYLFSFGAENSDDISIPKYIADREQLRYTPYILDDNYLETIFIENAEKTILLSNGTRNYKRTHYIYAIQQIGKLSDLFLTGIFGDEIFKIAHVSSGTVISANTINLIKYNFDIEKTKTSLENSNLDNYFQFDLKSILEEFYFRIKKMQDYFNEYENLAEKFYALRLEINLRKYFGNELNSYNDFAYGFSPFIDFDFLTSYAQSKYFGIYYPFNSNNFELKKMATQLYCKTTEANYPSLTTYTSSRGYSMKDSTTVLGNTKILFYKYMLKYLKEKDGFNTTRTNDIFKIHLKKLKIDSSNVPFNFEVTGQPLNSADFYSLYFWLDNIRKTYT